MSEGRLEIEFFEDVSANLRGREEDGHTDEHGNKEVGALVIQGCKRILFLLIATTYNIIKLQ